jgi:hypothetical protein
MPHCLCLIVSDASGYAPSKQRAVKRLKTSVLSPLAVSTRPCRISQELKSQFKSQFRSGFRSGLADSTSAIDPQTIGPATESSLLTQSTNLPFGSRSRSCNLKRRLLACPHDHRGNGQFPTLQVADWIMVATTASTAWWRWMFHGESITKIQKQAPPRRTPWRGHLRSAPTRRRVTGLALNILSPCSITIFCSSSVGIVKTVNSTISEGS